MSDPAGHYTDPLEDALSQGAQRVAQLASLLGAAGEVAVRARALRAARANDGDNAQASQAVEHYEREAYRQARIRWAPAHDPDWLARADLLQVARAWSAAACYADDDPIAAAAQRKCEKRLRRLHPFAMSRYDRLTGDGLSALDAMREAAPLFGRAAHARPGDAAPERPALDPALNVDISPQAEEAPSTTAGQDPASGQADAAEQRGRLIAERLQDRARARGHGQLGPEDMAMLLEAVTNLPEDTIEQIAGGAASPNAPSPGPVAAPSASTSRAAAQITAESFPYTAAGVLKSRSSAAALGAHPTRVPARQQIRPPRRPL